MHFLDVVRMMPAIDFANSRVRYNSYQDKITVGAIGPTRFRSDIPSEVHALRDPTHPIQVCVSREVKEAIEKAKPKVRGVAFDDLAADVLY